MDNLNLLNQLQDIILPEPPSVFPIAPGWYGLLILFVCLIGFMWYKHGWRVKRYRLKRMALRQIERLKSTGEIEAHEVAATLSVLLKKVSLLYYSRVEVAGLYGEKWLKFLDKTGKTSEFTKGYGKLLSYAPYQRSTRGDIQKTLLVCEKWISNRR